MRPLHHASVFSPYIFLKYIFFWLPFFHSWQFWATWVFWNLYCDRWFPPFLPFFCRRWLHLHQAVMENPCLVPTWTPVRRRRMNAAYSSWKSLPDVISGLDAGHSWAMVSLPFCLSRGIFVRVKNVRPVETLASMRGGGVGAGQTGNQSFTSPFSFQVIKYWGTDNKMPGHSNSCQTIGSKLI